VTQTKAVTWVRIRAITVCEQRCMARSTEESTGRAISIRFPRAMLDQMRSLFESKELVALRGADPS
jgi:hypothetical protein